MAERADAYNATLASGLVIDPFAGTGPGGAPWELDDDARLYLSMLDVGGDGVMGTVTIPDLDVALPIYHGSTESVLRRGAGHIYGSSLPVGGAGTHAVLAGHSGIPGARLFNDLERLAAGDVFKVSAAGREAYYRVSGSKVVDPEDVGTLGVGGGRDLLTLVTCTPVGVNSHRLLVYAERTDPPAEPWSDADAARLGFPWWVLAVVATVVVWVALARGCVRDSRRARGWLIRLTRTRRIPPTDHRHLQTRGESGERERGDADEPCYLKPVCRCLRQEAAESAGSTCQGRDDGTP